ncbi:MAG: hypothetical protein QN174_01250 [Armatimonadota bacterium]|nr:hypothetical protein [Armatimonadota bacterium]MDR7420858.1 hypothetical protein [Armatimonadota bacterium]MDR7453689.1 hypothetical protein [Armatimonadota bacterium]MDR7456615.1 hypothetical protein [Armatimonadota bacterium]MDR7495575.1 hypothetical protein [Armatimonadota bacterium]
MAREVNQSPAERAEEIVRRLRGVVAVRVVPTPEGDIDVVHVLGQADRSPKLIAIDVVSALAAELDVQLDARQVRVAALRPEEQASPVPQARLKFVGLSVSVVRGNAEVKVHLEDRGMLYEGIASGPGVPRTRLSLVAQATMRAVEVFLRAQGLLVFEGVGVHTVGDHEVAVVTVTLAGGDQETLAGASVVRDDPREAVVRAVLAAVNRPISWLSAHR